MYEWNRWAFFSIPIKSERNDENIRTERNGINRAKCQSEPFPNNSGLFAIKRRC